MKHKCGGNKYTHILTEEGYASVQVLLEKIKNASTSSVDKSVHEARVTSFLSYQAATPYLIAYFLGIESRHLDTTRYGVEDFTNISRTQLVPA